MAPHPRVLPWFSWDEWHQVMQGLFAPHHSQRDRDRDRDRDSEARAAERTAQQVWALEVVGLWRLRGRVPHSVDSTAQLIEALLNDSQAAATYRVGTSQRSETELRLSYSIIIVRAVNGLVDPSQQGYFADSVASLAQRIGLPAWFVELRHDATHQQLPSLTMLRTAAQHLVGWYRDNYWEPQREFLHQQTGSVVSFSLSLASLENDSGVGGTGQTDMLLLKETTFLTNIFIPALLQSLFFAVDQDQAEGEGEGSVRVLLQLQEQQAAQWSAVLKAVLRQSPHSTVGVANTLVCHLVATAAEEAERSGVGGGGRGVVVMALLAWWVRFVMSTLRDVLATTTTSSSSGEEERSSSMLTTLTNNLLQLEQPSAASSSSSSQSLPMSSCLPTACSQGLQRQTAALPGAHGVCIEGGGARKREDEDEEGGGGGGDFVTVVQVVITIYGETLQHAIRAILLKERVECPPFTSECLAQSSTGTKRKFSSKNTLTVQMKRLTSLKYTSEFEAHRQRNRPGHEVSSRGVGEGGSPAMSEENDIDILDTKEWLDSPNEKEGVTSPGACAEDSSATLMSKTAAVTRSGRLSWPLGLPVGCTRQQGSLLYLLEEA